MNKLIYYYKLNEDKTISETDLEQFCQIMKPENTAARQVDRTTIGDLTVSTVFLSMDQGECNGRYPKVFESMVFPDCEICVRYSTWDEAVIGHQDLVKELRKIQ